MEFLYFPTWWVSCYDPLTLLASSLLSCLFICVIELFEQIYQLPDWRLVFLVKNFPVGQRVLVDSSSGQSATQGEGKKEEVTRQGEIPLVKEVALVSLGNNHSRPYLLVSFNKKTKTKQTLNWIQTERDKVFSRCQGSRGAGAPDLRSVPVRSAAAAEQPESPLQESKSSRW